MRPTHILILLIVLLILFGAKRLPDVARSIGQSMKVFKKEISDLQADAATTPAVATQQALAPTLVAPVAGETAPTDR